MTKRINNKSVEFLKSLLQDGKRFNMYAHQKFSQVISLEEERAKGIDYQHKQAGRNNHLNRYYNIVPYDKNCIKLTDTRLGEKDGYINASWILAPYNILQHYIATQGPIYDTLVDFWRLVIEQHVPVIVCLTPEVEKGVIKCHRYWPLDNEQVLRLEKDEYVVQVKNIVTKKDVEADCIVRTLSVEFYKNNEMKASTRVTQLQYLGWPDHGVPEETKTLIALIQLARQFEEEHKPTLVHCSAGCGRTGTFCVVDTGERLLQKHQDILIDPIFLLTDTFRKQRTTMVQAQAQYNFCYKALLDYMTLQE